MKHFIKNFTVVLLLVFVASPIQSGSHGSQNLKESEFTTLLPQSHENNTKASLEGFSPLSPSLINTPSIHQATFSKHFNQVLSSTSSHHVAIHSRATEKKLSHSMPRSDANRKSIPKNETHTMPSSVNMDESIQWQSVNVNNEKTTASKSDENNRNNVFHASVNRNSSIPALSHTVEETSQKDAYSQLYDLMVTADFDSFVTTKNLKVITFNNKYGRTTNFSSFYKCFREKNKTGIEKDKIIYAIQVNYAEQEIFALYGKVHDAYRFFLSSKVMEGSFEIIEKQVDQYSQKSFANFFDPYTTHAKIARSACIDDRDSVSLGTDPCQEVAKTGKIDFTKHKVTEKNKNSIVYHGMGSSIGCLQQHRSRSLGKQSLGLSHVLKISSDASSNTQANLKYDQHIYDAMKKYNVGSDYSYLSDDSVLEDYSEEEKNDLLETSDNIEGEGKDNLKPSLSFENSVIPTHTSDLDLGELDYDSNSENSEGEATILSDDNEVASKPDGIALSMVTISLGLISLVRNSIFLASSHVSSDEESSRLVALCQV